MTAVLMLCTANICRSPAAEAVLQHALAELGLADSILVDSAGTTGWHRGEPAHEHSRSVGARRGYDVGHRSRPFIDEDFERFDLLVVMDGSHDRWLCDRRLRDRAQSTDSATVPVRYLRSFDPLCDLTTELDDPWGNPVSAYERMYDEIESAIPGLTTHLRRDIT